jgi:hypothetical protein
MLSFLKLFGIDQVKFEPSLSVQPINQLGLAELISIFNSN